MAEVISTAISRVFYDAFARELDVIFMSGRHHRYSGVPAAIYRQLVDATSKGAFFNACIRDRFTFEEIRDHPFRQPPPRYSRSA